MAMATSIVTLEKRYFDSCKREGVLPNKAIVTALFKAKIKKACREISCLVVSLDELKDVDFFPILDLLAEIDESEIDAVDLFNRSSCVLSGEYVSPLLRAVNEKLRFVDIRDESFGKDFLMDLSQRGLPCQILNLKSSHFRKLNMVGNFEQMYSLNLDFSDSLTSFRADCFSCMPNLRFLSLCSTRVANLWTTSAALTKLPSLVELRFQNCLHYRDNFPIESPFSKGERSPHLQVEDEDLNDDEMENSSDGSEVDLSRQNRDFGFGEISQDIPFGWNELMDIQNEISLGTLDMQEEDQFSSGCEPHLTNDTSSIPPENYFFTLSSPICYEKHYRDYMIASLTNLEILDNVPIGKFERQRAQDNFTRHFEHLPYNRQKKENLVHMLQKRESKTKSKYFYFRSLSAAKMGSTPRPNLRPLSIMGSKNSAIFSRNETRIFRPRQFEYHPTDPSLMVVGTLDGEVVVLNHESEKIVSNVPSFGAMNSVLGLCWLKKYPSKLIAGSDNGSLRLYDVQNKPTKSQFVDFDEFDQLTSVHVNSSDELFLASGYSNHVALYNINTAKCIQIFPDMHREHINVVKFSNHSPSLFATSSFDRDVKMWDLRQKLNGPCYTTSSSRGNVMVCFSPDDHYLLVSAVDNEVKQLLAVDGRLHLDFGISSTGSSQNYTRSYYMSGRDYVISGSCDEHVVRICCARTGRRLRDVALEGKGVGESMFVQSLRGDPFKDFHMSILATYIRPSSNSEIVKVNLVAPNDCEEANSFPHQSHSINRMGG